MKRYALILLTLSLWLLSGCSKAEGYIKTLDVKADDTVHYKIYDSDKITELKKDGKIYVHTSKIPLERIKDFEEKSFSKKILATVQNSQDNLYSDIAKYLNSYDFSGNDYALHNNRFDSVDESGVKQKRFFNKPIMHKGKVIGELIYKDNSFHCFSYELIYISKTSLYTTKIELYRIDPTILESESDYFEKKSNDFLPYYWISESKRLEFYRVLESNSFRNLPEEFQMLRMTKDLILNSLTINDN